MDTTIFGSLTVGTALAFLAGGVGVSIVAQIIKRVFKLESSKVIQFVVVALSFAATALDYVISAIHSNPSILASHAASILGIANATHTFIVSDADAFVSKVRTALADEDAQNAPAAAAANPTPAKPAAVYQPPAEPPQAAF